MDELCRDKQEILKLGRGDAVITSSHVREWVENVRAILIDLNLEIRLMVQSRFLNLHVKDRCVVNVIYCLPNLSFGFDYKYV